VTLLLRASEVEDLIGPEDAIEITAEVVREEAAGTTIHIPQFGGASTARGRIVRIVGGGLTQMGRLGVRMGGGGSICVLYDTSSWEMIAIVGYPFSNLRVGASMALAARYLAQPNAKAIGLLGSGRNALSILQCLKAVRPIEQVNVFSPTPEHRKSFAQEATGSLNIPVTAHDTPEAVIGEADIIVAATNSDVPVVTLKDVRPGVHVTSMGHQHEIDASLYVGADQFVALSRHQEIEDAAPRQEYRRAPSPMQGLLADGTLKPDSIIELGDIVTDRVKAHNGPSDITLYRESRGGVHDTALASRAYERARALGRGIEFDFR
jgi:ornithine cyclodeaminase/alanine dehydrogenase-like protein (mu-crystallin family)